ncbi:MAG: Lrp/AsnC family transcriptional regulator [Desulfatiglans sp.]|jgi:DNA-binding Lrp family transcriptional regulator|nr:Lrp/AsnC family transcriptional regulator [Desulfatiglans sp.]
MNTTDKNLLNEIQSGFPVTSRPFLEIGNRLGLSEDEVIARIRRLKQDGIIRRIGGNFNSKKLGFTSTLCAARVPEEKIESFVEVVNSYRGVTHNYLRKNPYNIWFTFIAPDMASIENSLREIALRTGVNDILNLPAEKMFKIKVDFEV